MTDTAKQLKALYLSPSTGFLQATKLYHKAKAKGIGVTLKEVKEFLSYQLADQLTKQLVQFHQCIGTSF